ncbi:MAG: hypothetical protein OZ921_19165 [Sorangiineae bacterium]|nr:hypothetical protein [Polyangiaceae bacterium]MEB2324644.1 hypothetical protein [Sorangiineae bacterium]
MRGTLTGSVIVVAGALLACRAKLDGNITVDGKSFEADACRSGEAFLPKFSGVDFTNKSNDRLRFQVLDTGELQVALFPGGAETGPVIGVGCGTLTMKRQNSKVNDIENIEGTISATCSGNGHEVKATVNFKNCH